MTLAAPTSSDYEAEANRLRAQIGETVEDLRIQPEAVESRFGSGDARGNR